MTKTAEIAGAGFAGLTAATELARRGWRVRVHERDDRPRALGAGIFLWDNGLRVLDELGALAPVLARGYEAPLWEERDADGTKLGDRPLGTPRMITLTRGDLLHALLAVAADAGVEVRTSSRVVAADPEGALVTSDGRRWPADLVVAADGLRSAARDGLDLVERHERFDFGLYRFLVPMRLVPERAGRWANYVNYWDLQARRRVLYVPCNDEDLYLLLGARVGDRALDTPLDAATWCASFPALRPVLAELPASPRYDRYEVLSLRAWSSGRVAVVGDAAHAMPPTLGQGAGTAMMNAINLARTVTDHDDLPAALRLWEEENRPVTRLTQEQSVAGVRTLFPEPGRGRDGWTEEAVSIAGTRPRSR
ncbi:NAD(P)/FAD-dependent oxidoreductase [Actinosynnema sp. NPDC023587]|uniref:FAD-dependent oxidoreductase n=1 Tax=Actinosynnema sp. NPDC023587 TaxID=3154695 RepID=UPI0033FF60B6